MRIRVVHSQCRVMKLALGIHRGLEVGFHLDRPMNSMPDDPQVRSLEAGDSDRNSCA